LKRDVEATVYLPYRQDVEHLEHLGSMTFLLRSHGSPETLLGTVREAVRQIDSNLPLFGAKTLTEQVEESMLQERQFARLTSVCGGLALLLASIGLYGTISYSVSRRKREFGIRMALGAGEVDILRSVMREMFLVAVGVLLGLAGAWAVTRWLSSLLFQLTPTDPLILTLATLIMVAVTAFAVFLPARRASRIDPNATLRVE